MKKRLLVDKPKINDRGQYTFFNDDNDTYELSNGLPINYDKFTNQDLYSSAIGDDLNEKIIANGLKFISTSNIKINTLQIKNSPVNYKIKSIDIRGYIFDNWSYQENGNNTGRPTDYSYSFLSPISGYANGLLASLEGNDYEGQPINASIAVDGETNSQKTRFIRNTWGTKDEGWSPGTIIDDDIIMSDIRVDKTDSGEYVDPHSWNYKQDSFDPARALQAGTFSEEEGLIVPGLPTTIYFAFYLKGNAKRWWGTDKRKKRIQIFQINTSDLFDDDGNGILYESPVMGYSDSYRVEGGGGGGGAKAPAFKVTKLQVTIDMRGFDGYAEDVTFSEDVNAITGSVQSPRRIDLQDLDNTFFTQDPSRELQNFSLDYEVDSSIKENFEPVPEVKILGTDEFDLQAYQPDEIDRQICSSPTQIELDYKLSSYYTENNDLENVEPNDDLGYKFLVLDWDDVDDKIRTSQNYLNSIPTDINDLLARRENNTCYFSDLGTPLIHSYSTPGIKTIKSIFFSHSITDYTQIIRWKFVKIRLFLDIPLSQYPDFGELGGDDYVTIPWPYTAPIIGGTDLNSKYQISLRDTLRGGKIGDTDIIDQRFLVDAIDNDELGQSILEFDLEQVRYFNDGTYDMAKLLGINQTTPWRPHTNTAYWNGNDWNEEQTLLTFPQESSVGQIFIDDNLDQDLVQKCQLELNTGEKEYSSIYDSSGNSNKGLLIGDYKITKRKKGTRMRRDSSIKMPRKFTNRDGAL